MKKFPFGRQGNKSLYGALPVSALGLMLALSGCVDTKLVVPKRIDFERSPQTDTASLLGDQQMKRTYSETDTPKMPATISGEKRAAQDQPAPAGGKADLTVSFDQMPLPTFIQAVYGSVLKANYSMDGAVAARTDLVTFHIPQPTTNAELSRLSRMLLKSYGVAVQDFGGVIRMVPDNASSSYSPAIRRGRASPETPQSLRPVFHYVELDAVRVNDFSSLLKTMFGAKIQATDDLGKNAILISGQPDDVAAAMEVIQVFDQPAMRGQRTKRVSPVFWTAEEFSKRLVEVLSAEGYAASTSVNSGSPILILPIPPINSVIIFSSSEKILNHVLQWSKELDKPSESQAGGAFFTYPVKYADAQALAKTLSELIGGSTSSTLPAATGPGANAAAAATVTGSRGGSKIVVNNATNSLIIQGGGADQYRQWMSLLAELDKPTKSALIDVMVAEVTAGTANTLGVDWNFRNAKTAAGGVSGTVTSGNAGSGSGGLTFSFLNSAGLMRADISALASKNDAQILSSPKLVARNGETATIQVADEVPILTSTTTTPGSIISGATTTNTIQYRTAGMILRVRPVINSGNRIDLDISQEVSNVKSLSSGAITSPTIGTRKVDTKLTLRDGSTVMLAGLISNDNSSSDAGVPLLKDIPGVGSLFKTETTNKNKKELIILITPYIINDDFEAESISNAFQSSLGDWAKDLKERTDLNALKRAPVNPENAKPGTEISAPVREPKLVRPVKEVTSAPEQQEPAPATSAEPSAAMPEAPAKDAPKKSDTEELGGVIMSKPVPAPVQNPASATSAAGQDKSATKPAAKSAPVNKPSNTVMPPIPGAKVVDDPDLLEELRRAAGLPKR
ncbi:secretin N-terminal domain-containing protein [Undibacterium sp. WLHG33]|uniref:secretin N-terminal domain-containing protein n=1 Tax=Undibacterium sp. WLHG33 TaxID=3412482 RepID=UPI003C2E90EC